MEEIKIGTPVHITNQFDRLFFDEDGTITETRENQDLTTSYYVDVPRLAHGRWFQREEFEVIGEQQEAEEHEQDSLVTIADRPGIVSWDFSSGTPNYSYTIQVDVDGKSIAQLMPRDTYTGTVYHWPSLLLPPPHHDGTLDDYHVFYGKVYSQFGPVDGIRLECQGGPEKAGLTPKQALSLLAWLKQEEGKLQQLMQEDEG